MKSPWSYSETKHIQMKPWTQKGHRTCNTTVQNLPPKQVQPDISAPMECEAPFSCCCTKTCEKCFER